MVNGPVEAWSEISPACIAISKAIITCPIPQNEKAGLSLMALVHFLAAAGLEFQAESRMKGDLDFHMRAAADLALASIKGGHKPVFKAIPTIPKGEA